MNSTGVQSRTNSQSDVSYGKDAYACCLVNGRGIAGLLAFNPNSWNLSHCLFRIAHSSSVPELVIQGQRSETVDVETESTKNGPGVEL